MSKETNKLNGQGIFAQGYGIIPKVIMKDKDLSSEAKAIYAYLASYAGTGTTAFPSVSLMCSDLNMSERRFYNHRKDLQLKGYIHIEQKRNDKGWKNNIYSLPVIPTPQNVCTRNVRTQNVGTQNVGTNNNNINNNSSNNNSSNKELLSTSKEVDDIPYKEIMDYLNEITDKNLRLVEGNKKYIRARWNEGYRLDDFKHVINVKNKEWKKPTRWEKNKKDMSIYLVPKTLFSNKFDMYLNQEPKEEEETQASRYLTKEEIEAAEKEFADIDF